MSRRLKPLLENFFVMHDKFPWSARTIQRVMKRIANKAGIAKPLTPHVLRHTFSILWIHKGGSTRALQGILGQDPPKHRRNLFEHEPRTHPAGVSIEVVNIMDWVTPVKIIAATFVIVGVIAGFFELRSSARLPWLRWLVWFVTSAAALLYIVLDYLESQSKAFQ
jgi:hypothetical protein